MDASWTTRTRIWTPAFAAFVVALGSSACGGRDRTRGDDDGGGDGIDTIISGITTSNETSDSDGDPIKFDVEDNNGPPVIGDCADALEDQFHNFIWISNSQEGTVSKINTQTGIEEARFIAGPDDPDPSRTSVNLLGDAVVVDRAGGIAKIAAVDEHCVDVDNNGVIDTSQGPDDVLDWGSDECVLWHVALPSGGELTNQYGPRPVAWEGVGAQDCTKPRVWVGWRDDDDGFFRRLDGETGDTEDAVSVPWPGDQWGPYGGATNKEGDFWVVGWQYGPLLRIDGDDVTTEVYDIPEPPNGSLQWTYGMALDANGHPWIAGGSTVYHFNPNTEKWDFIDVPNASFRGMMIDAEGRGWLANNGGSMLVEIDTLTKTVTNADVPLAGAQTPVGISIDSEGKVWVVDQDASMAFKLDPDTYQTLLTVTGLVSPYTYSDMTGAGLGLVSFPPTG